MTIYYSATERGFYDAALHASIPDDAIAITAEDHAALLSAQEAGKLIAADDQGRPIAIDPPAPDTDQLLRQLRARRDWLLRDSDFAVLPDAPFTEAERDGWRTYRQILRDLPETYAADPASVIWPDAPTAN